MKGKQAATILDIARESGVSKSTVSRVLNGRSRVSEEARRRVLEAVERLDYTPNGLARGLSGRRTGMVGFVLSDISNPFFPEIARGIEDIARKLGYTLFLANTDGQVEREEEAVRLLVERRVDGVIFGSVTQDTRCLPWLGEIGIPFVLAGRSTRDPGLDCVVVDNVAGGRLATEHLIRLGHARIAFIGGPPSVLASVDRYEGFRQALGAHGMAEEVGLVRWADFRYEGGYRAARALLRSARTRPTAIFAANDQMAIGALDAALDLGLDVPGDVAIVGFDDIPAARLRTVQLTTVAQPKYDIGSLAMQLLAQRIDERSRGVQVGESHRLLLAPRLIARRTCGAGQMASPNGPARKESKALTPAGRSCSSAT